MQNAPVILVASNYWLVGTMTTNGVRIQDIFNDSSTDYVRMHDVQIRQNAADCRLATSVPDLVVPKQKVDLVILRIKGHEAATKRANSFVRKDTTHVFLIVPGYSVQGELHVRSHGDSLFMLSQGLSAFFPVTQATVIGADGQPYFSPVVLANRSYVSCLYAGETPARQCETDEKLQSPPPLDVSPTEVSLLQQIADFRQSLSHSQEPGCVGVSDGGGERPCGQGD